MYENNGKRNEFKQQFLMATELTIRSLSGPAGNNIQLTRLDSNIYIGIDFGTSSTAVSIAYIDDTGSLKTRALPLTQVYQDGTIGTSEIIPTILAWYGNRIYVGKGAEELKYILTRDKNVWYSFKMQLGEDMGALYSQSELGTNCPFTILTPKDAAKVFFQYLKAAIEKYFGGGGNP